MTTTTKPPTFHIHRKKDVLRNPSKRPQILPLLLVPYQEKNAQAMLGTQRLLSPPVQLHVRSQRYQAPTESLQRQNLSIMRTIPKTLPSSHISRKTLTLPCLSDQSELSPTASHRSFKLPDGYIPTVGANLVISLHPPHRLNTPIPANGASQLPATAKSSDSKQESKKASTSRSSEHIESRKRTPKSADGDSSVSHYTLSRQCHINKQNSRPTHTVPRLWSIWIVNPYLSQVSLVLQMILAGTKIGTRWIIIMKG